MHSDNKKKPNKDRTCRRRRLPQPTRGGVHSPKSSRPTFELLHHTTGAVAAYLNRVTPGPKSATHASAKGKSSSMMGSSFGTGETSPFSSKAIATAGS